MNDSLNPSKANHVLGTGTQYVISKLSAVKVGTYLFRLESSEAEHADLVSDVLPGLLVAGALDASAQLRAHRDDAVRHQFHIR